MESLTTFFKNPATGNHEIFGILGTDPLHNMALLGRVCKLIPNKKPLALHTNGKALTRSRAMDLRSWGVGSLIVAVEHKAAVESATFGMGFKITYYDKKKRA